jgi:putative SOS response-associated peptidase YedK
MCGRYTLYRANRLKERFSLPKTSSIQVAENYNVAPGQYMPIVTLGDKGNEISLMKWGLIPGWAKDIKIGYKLINTRAETAFEKPMWQAAIKHRRCLVPAQGFYEWKVLGDGKTKQAYYIHPKDQDLFAFAGLWSTWHDVEGQEIRSFSIMTTEPNKEMAAVHNRMPVILHPEDEASWLTTSKVGPKYLMDLLHPYEDGGLEMYKTSSDVNSSRNNYKELIYPLTAQ